MCNYLSIFITSEIEYNLKAIMGYYLDWHFIALIIKYHNLHSLKQHIPSHSYVSQNLGLAQLAFLFWVSQAKIKVLAGWDFMGMLW